MADFLRDKNIGTIYTSPLPRCLDTAEVVSTTLNLPLRQDTRLIECSHGLCDGLLLTETYSAYPEYYAKWEKDKWNTAWPGGEAYKDVFTRAKDFITDLQLGPSPKKLDAPDNGADANNFPRPGENCLVIAHAQINMCLVGALMSLETKKILELRQKNGTIYIARGKKLQKIDFE
jgi:alpha-ribazole phosphatase